MVIQSIYCAPTQQDIEGLVKEQGSPAVFFKVLIELNIKSMLAYLAFDYRSIKSLLDTKNEEFFSKDFPLFYKDENQQSALDVALDNNLNTSVSLMIEYLVKYQNSNVYSILFTKSLIKLINAGIPVFDLLNSQIMHLNFEFDTWQAESTQNDKVIVPYNESMLKLRYKYPSVFREQWLIENE